MKQRIFAVLVGLVVCVAPFVQPGTAQIAFPEPQAPKTGSRKASMPGPPEGGRHVRSGLPQVGSYLQAIDVEATGISPQVLQLALSAIQCGVSSGMLEPPPTLTVIDYSKPSTEERLWVFDLRTGEMLFRELVAHGRNTGDNLARHFSDEMNSRQSSLGLFRTAGTYTGSNGYSLRLDGLEPGFNGRARERAIVMHGAPYVDAGLAATNGRIGRSWGCPALRSAIAAKVIDTISGGSVVFSYYPDADWLSQSRLLNCATAAPTTIATR